MKPSKRLLAVAFAAGVIVAPAASFAAVEFEVNVAPPADRVEVVPAPREGYTWERGYYRWDADAKKYEWNEGRFIANREGHRFIQHEWVHEGDKYRFRAGHWDDE